MLYIFYDDKKQGGFKTTNGEKLFVFGLQHKMQLYVKFLFKCLCSVNHLYVCKNIKVMSLTMTGLSNNSSSQSSSESWSILINNPPATPNHHKYSSHSHFLPCIQNRYGIKQWAKQKRNNHKRFFNRTGNTKFYE